MKSPLTFSIALVLTMPIAATTQPQTATSTRETAPSLDSRVRTEVAQFKGKVSLFAKNLDTGATYDLGGDNRVRTASTIKIAIMVEAFARVAEGKAKWGDEVVLTNAKKVSGSGVLQELSDGLKLTLRDAVTLMMIVSDNTATNLVLDVLTTDAVNARMDSLGLKQTRVLRKVGGGGTSRAGEDPALKPFGLGVTTPREMVTVMEKLERGEVINAAASKEMIALMKREQHRDGVGRALAGVEMATKAGALDQLRSDVGIIYSKRGRIAMAITCDDMPEVIWSGENPGYLMLSRLSQILIDGLAK
ncbi:MAG TPA: serine hydrolase [Blastocatellia bacterium]|nr:serine hydrolase [Blastocatellia bacterium]